MNKIKLSGFLLLSSFMLSANTCEKEMPEPPVVNGGSGGSNSSAYNCSAGYTGPKNDPQSSSFCQMAYMYRCQGDDAKADANCKIYKQMQADNPGMPNCSYCP